MTETYATLAQVKASARITDNVDDDLLTLAIQAASREIDQACERVFFATASEARVFVPRDAFVTEIDDAIAVSKIETDPDGDGSFDITLANKDFQLEPLNGFAGGIPSPITQIRMRDEFLFPVIREEATVRVTATYGFAEVPAAITQATVILASRIFKRNDSPLGVAGFGDLGVIRVGKLDPDVEALIHAFRKTRMA